MIIFSWNCRGLGNPATIRALKKFLFEESPDFVFLMETRLKKSEMEKNVRRFPGFVGVFVVDCTGQGRARSGGLCLLWRDDSLVSLISFNKNHISVSIKDSLDREWHFSGVYGWPDHGNKDRTWELVRNINPGPTVPWICVGDFNEIMWNAEKEGGPCRHSLSMSQFREVVAECEMQDIGFHGGHRFTWTNGRKDLHNIQERLDRALVNFHWKSLFPHVWVTHHNRHKSDHHPISVQFDKHPLNLPRDKNSRRRRSKVYRFENMWLQHTDCEKMVELAWNNGPPNVSFQARARQCGEILSGWGRKEFGDVRIRVKMVTEKLGVMQASDPNQLNIEECKRLETELDELLRLEEIVWAQRSRISWIIEGDRNTSFFHSKANHRKKRNNIDRLRDEGGRWFEGDMELEPMLMDYYKDLFRSETPENVDTILDTVASRVTSEMNAILTNPYSEEEILKALNQMHPRKAPGPDGMNPLFVQKFWHIIRHNVVQTALSILNHGQDPSPINYTHIVLIPKIKNPESPKDFRPISLCNVIVRIVSKSIANRLKHILPNIISLSQSAFIPERLITDNAMIAFEIFHSMKKKRVGREGHVALKLDMTKAYDRVEWGFLRAIMHKLGFDGSFITMVMNCVTTVSYSILLNGSPTDIFCPERGIRQGDPLSPYLFLLCAEGFTALLRDAEMKRTIHGFKVARQAPAISHLLFADDSILFFRATREEVDKVASILQMYEKASGQKINLEKSEMTMSTNVVETRRDELCARMGVRHVVNHAKYLGLPTIIGRSKKVVFASIADRVVSKMKGWKERNLSKGGKEVLLKAVVQAIPTYLMSCFLLPEGICGQIERAIRRFWWGYDQGARKTHWHSWSIMTRAKKEGGLGFRELACFNLAMLAKQVWRLSQNSESLVMQVFKAKYFPRGEFNNAGIGFQPSYIWRSLRAASKLVDEGTAWRVGNGKDILVKTCRWIGKKPARSPTGSILQQNGDLRVADFIDEETRAWKAHMVRVTFVPDDADTILHTLLSYRLPHDKKIWNHTRDGKFTVRSAYHLAVQRFSIIHNSDSSSSFSDPMWKKLWKIRLLPKIKHFLWRAATDTLPTKENLVRRGSDLDPVCSLCGDGFESMSHLTMHCAITREIWIRSPVRFDFSLLDSPSVRCFLGHCLEKMSTSGFEFICILLWQLWNARNRYIFEGVGLDVSAILSHAERTYHDGTCLHQNPSCRNGPRCTESWKPPPINMKCINSDMGVFADGSVGLGFVVRNASGEVMLAGSKRLRVEGSSSVREGLAMLYALQTTIESGIFNFIVQSDSKTLIDWINGREISETDGELVVGDIREIGRTINCNSFLYIPRSANKVAHWLAHFAHMCDSNFVWVEEVPFEARDIVLNDVISNT